MLLLITHHASLITSLLIPPLQVSAGDLSELARPLWFGLSALASSWVFYDARGRADFGAASVWAWALLTLAFPPAALPLYLAARLYTRRAAADAPSGEDTAEPPDGPPASGAEGEDGFTPDSARCEEEADAPHADAHVQEGPGRRRLGPALLYAAALALAGAAYFYADYRSFEARVGRAERAKLYKRPEEAMAEYRSALRVREDGHTRKLLAVELLRAGRAAEALEELRAAGRADEPDESLAFHVAEAQVELGRRAEAAEAYRQFLGGRACARPGAEARCDAARARLRALEGAAR